MKRIPEVECMGTVQEAREYADMDHSQANLSFVEALIQYQCAEGELLDLGTGPADIPLLLVSKSSAAEVTGIEISCEMLKIARLKVAEAGESRRIRLLEGDAKGLPFARDQFDGVFSNTILHHVADPVAYFKEAWRVLRPGGALVIRDLVRPESVEAATQLVETYAATSTDYQKKLFHDSLLAAYSIEETNQMLEDAGVCGAIVEMSSDRHMTIRVERR